MAPLSAERLRKTRSGDDLNLGVKAGIQCYRGGLAASLAGFATPARAAVSRAEADTLRVVGVFVDSVLGGGADGDVRAEIETGVFCFANSAGGDAITVADIGQPCFVVDDQTVAKTVGGGLRPIAGYVDDVDAQGVWVKVGDAPAPRRLYLNFTVPATELGAATAIELISPVVGAITQVSGIVQTAIVTGGDLTFAIGVTAVDGLAVTFADAAAKGTVVTDTPTAGHATTITAVGDRIQAVPAAAFNGGGAVSGFVEITY
ncbi:hypothetical protein [Phenylobacterium sp.]|uniref:hypothetical protein n=1 Tax=Phenylobacterium sp. TaxID=1871053 RepID=UPI0039190493